MRLSSSLHSGMSARRGVIQKAALHGTLGERLSCFLILRFSQFRIEVAEVFRAEFRQFIVPQDWQEAVNVLPVPGQGGLGQLTGSGFPGPTVSSPSPA